MKHVCTLDQIHQFQGKQATLCLILSRVEATTKPGLIQNSSGYLPRADHQQREDFPWK